MESRGRFEYLLAPARSLEHDDLCTRFSCISNLSLIVATSPWFGKEENTVSLHAALVLRGQHILGMSELS